MSGTNQSRRNALKTMARASCALAAGSLALRPLAGAPAPAAPAFSVKALLGEKIGRIRPEVYSHFTEHIGGVIYDGIWVGPDSRIANTRGIRQALLDHIRRIGKVAVRWPGGCFADRYHWRDGIGPRAQRPRRFGRWRDDTEPNHFGTHEFMDFCRLAGWEPYFAANVGTSDATEYQDWVEYCNAPPASTSLADLRAAGGEREPFRVRYWGVGNESWGCGGKFTPEDYCTEYRRFTEWVPGYGVPLYLIVAGPNGNDIDWTRRFFKKWADYSRAPIQGWAPHYYCGTTGHALNFNTDQWYEMLHKGNRMEKLLLDQWAALGEFDPGHRVKLIVDEWGVWHPEGTEINKRHLFEQMGTLRDALVAALTLDTFNRHADKVDMGNIAQLVNNLHSLFLADEDRFAATPTFHVYEMYRPHQGAESVRLSIEAPAVEFKLGDKTERIFRLAGSASLREKRLTLTLVHAHASEPAEVQVELSDGEVREVELSVLSHERLNAHNTFESPRQVEPRVSRLPAALAGSGKTFPVTLPPAAVARLEIRLS